MKKALVFSVLVIAMTVGAGAAQAIVRWPAHCTTMKCVNNHLNALQAQNAALKAVNKKQNAELKHYALVDYLFACAIELPVTADTTNNNYLFPTLSGNTPDAWLLGDGCNTGSASVPGLKNAPPLARMIPRLFQ